MKVSEFINKYSLKFKNPNAENEFNVMRNEGILQYNKWFSVCFFFSTILNTTITAISTEKAKLIGKLFVFNNLSISYCALALSLLFLFLTIFTKNIKLHKAIGYNIFVFYILPVYNLSRVIWEIYTEDKDLYSLLSFFILVPKILMMFFQILSFIDSLVVAIVEMIILIGYFYFTKQNLRIIYSIVYLLIQIIFSYVITRKIKENLLYVWASNERNRYLSIFENMKSCFLNFSKKKIKFLNKIFQETIMRNRLIKNINLQSKIKLFPKEPSKIPTLKLYELENENIDENQKKFIEEYSEPILIILLENLANSSGELSSNNKDSFITIEQESIFSLDMFLCSIKENYMNKEMRGNFMFLGFKEMRLICDETNKIIKRKYEVYYRVIIREEEEFELMFNDISDIKENEEKNAELKYKSMFLSKVAHEFKNPLICISELVTELNIIQTSSERNEHSNNNKFIEIIKQIQSMSEYLLILIKDLDYFSNVQISKDPPNLEIDFVDLKNQVIPFCRQIGESLINKLNKNKVKIHVENNLPMNFKFKTDEIKLKQILINLISNAVKFTNEGIIKLIINLVVIQNQIIFEVSDSGIGMQKEQIECVGSPYKKGANIKNKYGSGLGLYVVSQILKQLGSELKCSSIVGKGTTFSFSQTAYSYEEEDIPVFINSALDSQLEEGDSKASTIKIKEQELEIINNKELLFARGLLRMKNVNISNFQQSRNLKEIECVYLDNTDKFSENLSTSYFIVVDDEKFTRQATLRVLKSTASRFKLNYSFIELEDGVECISTVYKLLKDGIRIEGIISDEMMIHMNGSTAAEILKKLKNLNSQYIPFYLLSALTDFNNNYIDSFISKPIVEKEAIKIFNNYK